MLYGSLMFNTLVFTTAIINQPSVAEYIVSAHAESFNSVVQPNWLLFLDSPNAATSSGLLPLEAMVHMRSPLLMSPITKDFLDIIWRNFSSTTFKVDLIFLISNLISWMAVFIVKHGAGEAISAKIKSASQDSCPIAALSNT